MQCHFVCQPTIKNMKETVTWNKNYHHLNIAWTGLDHQLTFPTEMLTVKGPDMIIWAISLMKSFHWEIYSPFWGRYELGASVNVGKTWRLKKMYLKWLYNKYISYWGTMLCYHYKPNLCIMNQPWTIISR